MRTRRFQLYVFSGIKIFVDRRFGGCKFQVQFQLNPSILDGLAKQQTREMFVCICSKKEESSRTGKSFE